jgi:gliding motility-associated-like protein
MTQRRLAGQKVVFIFIDMRKLYVVLALLMSFVSTASHLAGGDIQYRYIGDSTGIARHYKVILRVYRDVTGIPMPTTDQVTVSSGCYANINIPMTLQAGSGLVAPTLFDCVTPGSSGTKTLEIYTYKGFVILPGICSTYKFWYDNCCRPGNITNIFTSNGSLGNDGFFFDADLDNTSGENSSPIFISEPVRAFCVNKPFNWSQKSVEYDGDSVHYQMINCRENAYPNQTNIPFDPGFSATQPVTSTYFNLNPKTGTISFLPTSQQIDVMSIKISEYRYDSLWGNWYIVGSSSRDMMISISANCSPAASQGVILDYNYPGQYLDSLTMLPAVDYDCGDSIIDLHFVVKLDCESIAEDGTDFRLTNPNGQPIPIKQLSANCDINGETQEVTVHLFKPLLVNGRYFLYSKTGNDGNTLTNKCGFPMDEFDTLVLIVDDCAEPVWEFKNVTVIDDNHTSLEWVVDGASCDTSAIEGYGIFRWDGTQYVFRQLVTKWDKFNYDDLTATNVDGESYSYKIDFRYSGFIFGPSDSIHSIWLRSNGECDSLNLVWNPYNGWVNPQYDVYINYQNQWIKWNQLPITDTTYILQSDTLEVGNYNIKVVTTDGGYTSESNYIICVQPAPPVIIIPNVFTPNNDGINEYFNIRNLLLYDHRKVVIYNRWGKVIYKSDNYNNDWDGKNIPDGVYFGKLETIIQNELVNIPFTVTILHN